MAGMSVAISFITFTLFFCITSIFYLKGILLKIKTLSFGEQRRIFSTKTEIAILYNEQFRIFCLFLFEFYLDYAVEAIDHLPFFDPKLRNTAYRKLFVNFSKNFKRVLPNFWVRTAYLCWISYHKLYVGVSSFLSYIESSPEVWYPCLPPPPPSQWIVEGH